MLYIYVRYGHYECFAYRILNKSWQQHPTRRHLYGHLPPITKTIQDRRTRHAGHCWRSKDEMVSDVLMWTSAYGQSKAGRSARTYIQQLCDDKGCNIEDLPEAMNDRETCWERGSGISVLAARHDDEYVHFTYSSMAMEQKHFTSFLSVSPKYSLTHFYIEQHSLPEYVKDFFND